MKLFVENTISKKIIYCTSHNFKVVAQSLTDKLLGGQLAFFKSLAAHVEPFLTEFQSNSPLAPFLYESLSTLIQSVLQRFVKPEILKANLLSQYKINVLDSSNLLPAKDIELSFYVKDQLLRKIPKSKDVDILKFRRSCLRAYQAFAQKLFLRSPLNYAMTKAISCLDPTIVTDSKMALKRLSSCLQQLVHKNWLSGLKADRIQDEFKSLISQQSVIESIKAYRRTDKRLDHHWSSVMDACNCTESMKSFVHFILVLSHGNAFLERGFSINSECIIENMQDESMVALRQVYDGVLSTGTNIEAIQITNDMIRSVKNAHSMYINELDKKRQEEKHIKVAEDSRKLIAAQVKTLEEKRIKMMVDAQKEAGIIEQEIQNLRKCQFSKY